MDDVVSEVSTVSGETVEQVRSRLASDWRVTVSIEGKKESPYTRFYFQSWENGNWENGGFEPTGDDEQTIKDVMHLKTDAIQALSRYKDEVEQGRFPSDSESDH